MGCLQVGGQGDLVEDVSFMVLHQEKDAERQRGGGFGGPVAGVGGGEAGTESLNCVVGRRYTC